MLKTAILTFTFALPINAPVDTIWNYYSDMSLRSVWEEDLESIKLDTKFVTGATGEMKLKDMPLMKFTLTSVKDKESFWDETIVPELGSIKFGHEIFNKNSQNYIRHTVVFEKEKGQIEKGDLEFFKGLTADTSQAMWLIKEAAEK